MPDEKGFLFHYSAYFTKTAPSIPIQMVLFLLIGAIAGLFSTTMVNYNGFATNPIGASTYGVSFGILIISLPALLTVALLKIFKRRLQLKHIMLATVVSSASYAVFVILASLLFSISKSHAVAYVLLILGDASIYGYWILLGKFFVGQRRSAGIIALLQPVLNVLLYVPMDKFVLLTSMPFEAIVIKLFAGMVVFLAVVYFFIYFLDRPMKKSMNISGIDFFSVMVAQWLYNFTAGERFINPSSGTDLDIPVEMLYLKNANNAYKAAFIKPAIHYGPFAGVGGAIATEQLGNLVARKLHANPFVMHGAVTMELNPISTMEVQKLSKELARYFETLDKMRFAEAKGSISRGRSGSCMAIRISVNETALVVLSKAPYVTEDIHYDVGMYLKGIAESDGTNAVIIDAHNSRIESATKEELRGVYKESKYAEQYALAIQKSAVHGKEGRIMFGSASRKLSRQLVKSKDIGNGYASVGIFGIAGKKFALIYFDANNMMPKFRDDIISHVKNKFGMQCEVLTTDTHAVNSITLTASNVLGRSTRISDMLPIIDEMIKSAVASMEQVYARFDSINVRMRVWGEGAEKMIMKASTLMIRHAKRIVPIIIVAGFVIAAWAIYII